MSQFSTFTHLEEKVEALQLSPASQSAIVKALGAEAAALLLTKLAVDYSTTKGCYEFVFRYKTDTVESNLTVGDYLVRLNTGSYVVRTEEQFLQDYIHTAVDPIIPVEDQKTPKKALVDFVKAFYPGAGIEDEDDLTPEALQQISNGLSAWYDPEKNVFDIKFTDCSIVDPTGLVDIMSAFPSASFMNDQTTFTLNFNNGAYHEGDPNTKPNQFNYISLQLLEGELKKLSKDMQKRLVGITFLSVKTGSPSAVAPSVTDAQWLSFCNGVMAFSGITTSTAIKR